MSKYGQFCPVAKALEIVGDRWTLLIIRDLLLGTTHFNDLERGLPGISRGLLARRLQHLQKAGVIEKRLTGPSRQATEYRLTQAGQELLTVVLSLRAWGETWAFGEPTPDDMDPVLLMWWLRGRVNRERLPDERVVAEFDFHGFKKGRFWLVMTCADVTVCLTDPGYEVNVLIYADLADFLKLYAGRLTYQAALEGGSVRLDGAPGVGRAFPAWFGWSEAPVPA